MTIKKRLYISFSLILFIIIFIIGVFFYTIFNLNEIHSNQNHRYDQIRRVEKIKEFNNSFSWIVLDIITDYNKIDVVKSRLNKADKLFKELLALKENTLKNSESTQEKKNLKLIFSHLKEIKFLIRNKLSNLILLQKEKNFDEFNKKFEIVSFSTTKLLEEEIDFLQKKLNETEYNRDQFIDTIKIELVILLLIAFSLSFIISTKIITDMKSMLKKLNSGVLQLFKEEENSIKIDIGENNELSEITKNLNSYLKKQSDMIHSREELLRNISHELKTPIAKGKFLLEELKTISHKNQIQSINNVFVDIEELTSKLLQREKLNFATLNISNFRVSTLILESLSKLSIDDESKVILDIEDDFEINADKYYLTIALKNLIDNAMKYAIEFPIKIESKENTLYIKNVASKLSNDFIYYIQPFTREPNQQLGHGLGLNIVNKIIVMHKFKLDYFYENSYNTFFISFKK